MNWDEIWKWVAGGGAFALVGTILNFLIKKQGADTASFEALKKAYQEEFRRQDEKIDKLIREVEQLRLKYEESNKEVEFLKAQLESMKNAYPDLPIPLWLKDRDGVMISLNDAYEKAFLIPQGFHRRDYIGRSDESVWGRDIAEVFKKNDLKVIEKGEEMKIVFEDVKNNEILMNWEFLKYPKIIDGHLVAIGGIAIPKRKDIVH